MTNKLIFVSIAEGCMLPDEDKLGVSKFLTNILITLREVLGKLGDKNPRHLFPELIAADNPRPIKNCFIYICNRLYCKISFLKKITIKVLQIEIWHWFF